MEGLATAGKRHDQRERLAQVPNDCWMLGALRLVKVANTEPARPAIIKAVHRWLTVLGQSLALGHVARHNELALAKVVEPIKPRRVELVGGFAHAEQPVRIRE